VIVAAVAVTLAGAPVSAAGGGGGVTSGAGEVVVPGDPLGPVGAVVPVFPVSPPGLGVPLLVTVTGLVTVLVKPRLSVTVSDTW
jgi:hypothetical protein